MMTSRALLLFTFVDCKMIQLDTKSTQHDIIIIEQTWSKFYTLVIIEMCQFQAAIRGLLDIMSGNNGGDSGSVVSGGSSAYDTNSVCTTADASVEPGGYACMGM